MFFYTIAVFAPLKQTLTYSYKKADLQAGQLVSVPLGRRSVQALVIKQIKKPAVDFKIKSITQVYENDYKITKKHLDWLIWLSEYYLYPIGLVAKQAFPPLGPSNRKSKKKSPIPESKNTSLPLLTKDQKKVIQNIKKYQNFKRHLLFGVTGSGKTEVYMRVIQTLLDKNKQALLLVPEISLTPQLIQRFSDRFPNQVASIHSQLTPREKTNQWLSISLQKKSILIGTRSALFCFIPKLACIIVDEEHDPSFKQEETLKYHARDAAIVKAQLQDIPIILGSATPSLETWKQVQDKNYLLQMLPNRISPHPLPPIDILNLCKNSNKIDISKKPQNFNIKKKLPFWLHQKLFNAIKLNLEKKEQIALLLNRRGFASQVLCSQCAYSPECPNCSIHLTLHKKQYLVCHYCEYSENFNTACPQCSEKELKTFGLGTEQVEQELKALFPLAKIIRADRDEITKKEDYEQLINNMEEKNIDILVGTQMIAKGLDFPNLSLVGVLLADSGFYFPDFRSNEKNFQLLVQMSGRAGRADKKGQVFIQSFNPDHPCLDFVKNQDYLAFAKSELQNRKNFLYPPFYKLALIKIQSLNDHAANKYAKDLVGLANQWVKKYSFYKKLIIAGPAPAILFKMRNKYRYQILIKSPEHKILNHFCKELLDDKIKKPSSIKCDIDIDPLQL